MNHRAVKSLQVISSMIVQTIVPDPITKRVAGRSMINSLQYSPSDGYEQLIFGSKPMVTSDRWNNFLLNTSEASVLDCCLYGDNGLVYLDSNSLVSL